jgi:hypothetical protein
MYSATLLVHSYLRWAVLLLGLLAFLRSFTARRTRRPWTPADDGLGRWFIMLLDTQVLIGLLLYLAISPITRQAFSDFGAAMGNSVLRFWAVEHIFGMLVGLALAHVGRARARRGRTDADRHRFASLYFGLALVAILVSIPWPGVPAARPLLRW